MILSSEGAIAMLREMGERDLAIVMIVATMADSEDEAIERLGQIEATTREWRRTLHASRQRSQCRLAEEVVAICPRLVSAITQTRDAGGRP
jgi:hypothetical protein